MDWVGFIRMNGGIKDGYERFDERAFDDTAELCERWDQTSLDPGYDTLSFASLAPMTRSVFDRMARALDVTQQGVCVPFVRPEIAQYRAA